MNDDRLTVEDVAAILHCRPEQARRLMGDRYLARTTHGGDLPPAPGKRSRPGRYLKAP